MLISPPAPPEAEAPDPSPVVDAPRVAPRHIFGLAHLAQLAFWVFVLGGVASAFQFVGNTRALLETPIAAAAPVGGDASRSPLPFSVPLPLPMTAAPASSGSANPPGAAPTTPTASSNPLVNLGVNLLPEWQGTDRVNILLLGIDKRPDEPANGTRSDTMIVLSIDPVGKAAAMVSLPRDMWVNIPGYGEQRINVAHAVGGPDLAMKTVTADFGIPIQYYARVDFSGFQQLVDTVGGVIVDVDHPVIDDEYPTPDYGYMRVYIPPGPQLMDGETALEYARSRHSENDFARAARQQRVIVAVRDRALRLNMLPKAPQLLGIVQQAVTTNLSPVQMLQLARLSSEIDRSKIADLVLDTRYVTPFTGDDGADLLAPDYAAIRAALSNALLTAAHPELQASIEVQNGTSTPGLGQAAANVLVAKGYNVVQVDNADRANYSTSSVQVLTGNDPAGSAIAQTLKLASGAVQDTPLDTGVDIRVVIGQDYAPAR